MADDGETTATGTLASAMLSADNVVILTGLRLGWDPGEDQEWLQREWRVKANLDAFLTEPRAFWEFYYPVASRIYARDVHPAHVAVARLQRAGIVTSVITQAVDHLHARAGAEDVVEVYSNMRTIRCERCGEVYGLPEAGPLIEASDDGIPRCAGCNYPLRPTGTLWGEPLPQDQVERAWELAAAADAFFAFDSDLRTAPISLLPSVPLTRQVPLYIIGEEPTQYDRYAALVVREPAPAMLGALADLLTPKDERR